jgi:predicted flap endonuclease-1-like 5' DNA nuclease
MIERKAYRQRVATVRGRARAQLAAIRMERLARMRAAGTGDPLADAWLADQLADEIADPVLPAAGALLTPADGDDPAQPVPGAGWPVQVEDDGAVPPDAPVSPAAVSPSAPEADARPLADPPSVTEVVPSDDTASSGAEGVHVSSLAPAGAAAAPEADGLALPSEGAGDFAAKAIPAASGCDGADAALPAPDPGAPVADPQEPEDVIPASHEASKGCATVPLEAERPPDPTQDADDPSAGTGVSHEPAATDPADLSEIPGIGPGLVWMLRNAGVGSLHDLARAEADPLARRLGPIARLLDLDYFIGFARARTRTD